MERIKLLRFRLKLELRQGYCVWCIHPPHIHRLGLRPETMSPALDKRTAGFPETETPELL